MGCLNSFAPVSLHPPQVISTHLASDKVVEPAVTAVAVACLRHPEHATLMVSSGVFPLLQQVR